MDPCGSVMDILRSHNLTPAEIGEERGTIVPLRWYEAAADAKWFPDFHAFGHPAWEDRDEPPLVGPYCLKWTDWRPRKYPKYPGQHFHGPLEWFRYGIPQAVLDAPRNPDAVYCAAIPRRVFLGGEQEGGSFPVSSQPVQNMLGGEREGGIWVQRGVGPAPFGHCPRCEPNPTPAAVTIHAAGMPPGYGFLEGDFHAPQIAACVYATAYLATGVRYVLTEAPGDWYVVLVQEPGQLAVWWDNGTYRCISGNPFTLQDNAFAPYTPTVEVTVP